MQTETMTVHPIYGEDEKHETQRIICRNAGNGRAATDSFECIQISQFLSVRIFSVGVTPSNGEVCVFRNKIKYRLYQISYKYFFMYLFTTNSKD